ncbi:MAG: hypothetical protein AAFQ43_02895 [Bacteroidota bacterium]
MSFRRLLLALALVAAGVLIGLPIARIAQPAPTGGDARGEEAPAPPPAVAPEPVQIGPEEGEEPVPATQELPELRTLNRLFTSVASRAKGAVVYIEVDGRSPMRTRSTARERLRAVASSSRPRASS